MINRSILPLALLLAGLAGVGSSAEQAGAPKQKGFITPERRTVVPPPTVLPLPPQLLNVPAVTLTMTVGPEGEQTAGSRRMRTVSRTSDRVHLAEGRDTEWLFRRNPLAPERVSAWRIDHRSQTLVVYDESDVRNLLGIGGWAGIVSLGFEHALLAGATATSEERRVGTVRFVRYESPIAAFFWSAEAGLATHFVQRSAAVALRVTIETASDGVNEALVRDPVQRFPAYTVLDVADWLEHPVPPRHP